MNPNSHRATKPRAISIPKETTMLRRAATHFVRAARAPSGSRFAHVNGTSPSLVSMDAVCDLIHWHWLSPGNQIRTGMALDLDGKIYRVTKSQHVKPGKGGAYVQCDLKEIKTGSKTNRRFRAAESVAKAALGPDQTFQYLYREGDKILLMHTTSFEQVRRAHCNFRMRMA
jgi:translation elongation factor P/translation initiation factor 5A